jgi:outer membrane protein OmpA-like peptidoglycan-associated protein
MYEQDPTRGPAGAVAHSVFYRHQEKTTMKTLRFKPARTALAMAAITVLAACASTPLTNPKLDDARSAYQRAAADTQVARSAPMELQRAQESLQRGEAALRAGDDAATVEHYAYLTRRRTEAAMQTSKLAQADEAIAQARAARDRILIEARAREADQQRASAERARADAESARKLAESRAAAAETARQQAEAAQTRAAKLEAQLAEMKARKTDRGMVLTLGDVLFDTGRAELKPGAMRTIDQLATFMKEDPERTVQIEGYTDSTGSDALNQALSERRAEAVRVALIDRGIDMRRIAARGFGKSNPVASNDTAAGRQQNRRVEVVISSAS